MKRYRAFKKILKCFGVVGGIRAAIRQLYTNDLLVERLYSKPLDEEVYLRLNTTDFSIYNQMFKHLEYDIPFIVSPRIIVDAGANIGLSALYFANRFPEALIYAIEPDASNFEIMRRNVVKCDRIVPIHAALWFENTELDLYCPPPGHAGTQKDGFQTLPAGADEATSNRVRAISPIQIMKDYKLDHIDLLKIDIEGSERELFLHADDWIERVEVIICELHDRLRAGCSRNFYTATTGFALEMHKGENVIVGRAGTLDLHQIYKPPAIQQGH
jgi:FkbM family methyltransferase